MKDDQIVALYLSRNQLAIAETSEKYGRRIQAVAYGIVCDHQTAEECESDTYLEAWNRIPPHEPRDYLYAFLIRITRHLSLNRCREKKALKRDAYICQLSAEMEQCIPDPVDLQCRISEAQLKIAINSFLSTLPSQNRIIFLKRYFFGSTIKTISRQMQLKENTVKSILYRCRQDLRSYLIKEGYEL